ncbi:hypothetical protein C0992_006001 [Termitomyces sp. T32_za158]|nr:hypothetical protein C0992_006001 [Termitomyces sp. T32_za158]
MKTMRFSALEIPKFLIPTPNRSTYTASAVAQKHRQSAPHPATLRADPSHLPSPSNAIKPELMPETWSDSTKGTPSTKNASLLREFPGVYPSYSKETLSESSYSIPVRPESPVDSCTSLSTVRELVSQFPPLPPRAFESIEHPVANNGTAVDLCNDSSVFPRATMGTTVESVATPFIRGQKYSNATTTTRYLDVTAPDSVTTTPTTTVSGCMANPTMSMSTALTDEAYVDLAFAGGSMKSRFFGKDTSGRVEPTRGPVDWIDFDGISGPSLPPVIEDTGEGQVRHSQRSGSTDSLRISWLQNGEEPQLVRAVSLKSQVARIKSIGRAPIRVTPRPVKNDYLHESLHIERVQVPSREDAYNLEILQGSLRSSHNQSPSRDSAVLGMEDLSYPRHQHVNNSG